jgi:hypothetical protein
MRRMGFTTGVQFWISHKYILSSSCVFLANRLEYLPYGRALATSVAMAPETAGRVERDACRKAAWTRGLR